MTTDSGCVKVEVCVSSDSSSSKPVLTSNDGKENKRGKEVAPPICIDATICKPRSNSAKLLIKSNAAQIRPYLGQDFYKIKEECAKSGKLFEDPYFKCNDSSLPKKLAGGKVSWKRPRDFEPEPHFAAKSLSRLDIDQGNLGDCWFLASIAALSIQGPLFKRVVPLDNSFRKENNYAGIFHFRFWQYGEWVDVVVDDRLPIIHGKPAFLRSMQKNVFWSALLEKAYAKLCGGYEALVGGHEEEAMEDLTGGITYSVKLRKEQVPQEVPSDLYDTMYKAIRHSSLLGCLIGHVPKIVTEEGGEQKLDNGLVAGHAYTITAVRMVHLTLPSGEKKKEKLLRIRNPWGHRKPTEWKGDWGDKSELWTYVRAEERSTFLKDEEDGEFWMCYEDWKRNFDGVTICYLGPDTLTDKEDETRDGWRQVIIRDRWEKNVNAGGMYGHSSFWKNPQYVLRVPEVNRPESADSDGGNNKTPNVVIGLMQIGRKTLKAYDAIDYLAVLPIVFQKIDGHRERVAPESKKKYAKVREVVIQTYLPPGEYLLVASSMRSIDEGDFLLRVFAEGKIDASREELEESTAVTKPDVAPIDIDLIELSPEELKKIEAHAKHEELNKAEGHSKHEKVVKEKDADIEALKVKEHAYIGKLFKQMARKAAEESEPEMDAWALQKLLNTLWQKKLPFQFDGIAVEICRSLIALLDVEQSGSISEKQFVKLYKLIRTFKQSFVKEDAEKTGKLTTEQFRSALRRAGCSLSRSIFYAIVKRYCDPEGFVHFDDFVLCASRLRTAIETFDGLAKTDNDAAVLTRDQFVQLMLSC